MLVTKFDIQTLAASSSFFSTGDPHRVTAVLKQLKNNPADGLKLSMLPKVQGKLYYIVDVVLEHELSRSFDLCLDLFDSRLMHFRTNTDIQTSQYKPECIQVNRIVDNVYFISNIFTRMGGAEGSVNYIPNLSILYYELSEF